MAKARTPLERLTGKQTERVERTLKMFMTMVKNVNDQVEFLQRRVEVLEARVEALEQKLIDKSN